MKQLEQRVNYYNKMTERVLLPVNAESIGAYIRHLPKNPKVYFFDTYEYIKYFSQNFRFFYVPGDVVTVSDYPSIVKSRPIEGDNKNSVLLNLNKIRHFLFIKKDIPTNEKLNSLVWRGGAFNYQPHRMSFLQKYYNHPVYNIGKVNKSNNYTDQWLVNRMTINEQLKYKYIMCLEGNDVATNLKWVMSSNSVAVMPRPKYETWFMEGTLIPNVHYIEIKDDYS
ncbi:MAG: glycosyl transferase family 90, partial [Methylococcaceae bacterium]